VATFATGTWNGRAAIPLIAFAIAEGCMRQFQRFGAPGSRFAVAVLAVASLALGACLDNVPPELRPMVDSRLPRAVSLAESAAARCAAHRAGEDPEPAVSPAVGTSLAEELEVVEIVVRCDWEPSDGKSPAGDEHSFTFPPLRQTAAHTHSPPPALVYDTFVKRGDRDFERVHVPSQFSDVASSADIVVTRLIPGGGTVEVTVATVKR
jgi:hypothetical protein